MKTILITTFSALLLGLPMTGAAAAPAAKEETVTQQMHDFWIKSKAYLSNDWNTFKEGAQITLADLDKQISAVAAKTDLQTPGYFQLRLQALKEQRAYLTVKLAELNDETIKVRMSGPRYVFDQCVSALEAAINQANSEADVLSWIRKNDKEDES
jgi:hypothetical protein